MSVKTIEKSDEPLGDVLRMMDVWRVAQRSIRLVTSAPLAIMLICLCSSYSLADEINEFDESADGWTVYPSTMGRGSESGWVNVTNDGEGSIRNNPTGTRYTY